MKYSSLLSILHIVHSKRNTIGRLLQAYYELLPREKDYILSREKQNLRKTYQYQI